MIGADVGAHVGHSYRETTVRCNISGSWRLARGGGRRSTCPILICQLGKTKFPVRIMFLLSIASLLFNYVHNNILSMPSPQQPINLSRSRFYFVDLPRRIFSTSAVPIICTVHITIRKCEPTVCTMNTVNDISCTQG